MEKKLVDEAAITINAPQSKVWDALVNPEQTRGYMFGCEISTDFQKGSRVDWQANVDGKYVVYVTGVVVDYQPESLFSYTTFDPHGKLEDIPENHVTVECRLSEEDGKTRLHVTQGDFAKVGDGEARWADVQKGGGWARVLEAIKTQIEG